MTTRLEDELAAGLHERAAGVRLDRDVLAAARRRHRRRTTVTRAVSAAGTVGVTVFVIAVVLVNPPPPAPAAPEATPAGGPTAVRLDAATVSARVSQALTDAERLVLHVDSRVTIGDRVAHSDLWSDPVSGRLRKHGDRLPDAPRSDELWETRAGEEVVTHVDHDDRTWWRDVLPAADPEAEEPAAQARDVSAGGLREALRRGEFEIVGRDRLDRRATVHLRLTDRSGGRDYDVWVDAESFVPVRKVMAYDDGELFRVQEDYEYLPRSAAVLAELELDVPDGYRRVPAPR